MRAPHLRPAGRGNSPERLDSRFAVPADLLDRHMEITGRINRKIRRHAGQLRPVTEPAGSALAAASRLLLADPCRPPCATAYTLRKSTRAPCLSSPHLDRPLCHRHLVNRIRLDRAL